MAKRKWYQIKLGAKFAAASIVLAILLSAALTAAFYISYEQSMVEKYTQQIKALVNTAAEFVDREAVRGYIEGSAAVLESGGGKAEIDALMDENYLRFRKQYITIQRENELEFLYAYHPDAGGLRVLTQGTTEADSFHYELGYYSRLGEVCTQDDIDYAMDLLNNPDQEKIYISDTVYGYLITAYAIVPDETGAPYLVVGADMSMQSIRDNLNRYLELIAVLAVVVVSLFIGVYLMFLRRNIISPLQALVDSAVKFVTTGHGRDELSGLQCIDVQIRTGDEIEDLALAFKQMTQDIITYISDLTNATSARERIETELRVATQIQEGMLPRDFSLPGHDELKLFACMRAARDVGGDFYDFFFIDPNHICLVIGDVSGKGVPAALFMAMAKAQVKDLAMRDLPVEQIMFAANNSLCKDNEQGMFVTLYVAILNLTTGQMDFCDAGHNPAMLWHKNGSVDAVPSKKGLVAGGMEDVPYKSNTIYLEPGDILYTYTDGVSEAQNQADELYGDSRILHFISQFGHRDAKALCEGLVGDVDVYAGEAPQFDDITMLAIEYNGRTENHGND